MSDEINNGKQAKKTSQPPSASIQSFYPTSTSSTNSKWNPPENPSSKKLKAKFADEKKEFELSAYTATDYIVPMREAVGN
jgi:hypothetical protein